LRDLILNDFSSAVYRRQKQPFFWFWQFCKALVNSGFGFGVKTSTFFMVFPNCFGFYIGNLLLASNFAWVILGGTKQSETNYP